jgi:hypothetical protein
MVSVRRTVCVKIVVLLDLDGDDENRLWQCRQPVGAVSQSSSANAHNEPPPIAKLSGKPAVDGGQRAVLLEWPKWLTGEPCVEPQTHARPADIEEPHRED